MIEETAEVSAEREQRTGGHIVHALMQFVVAVRQRLNVLIGALVVSFLLAGLYYATATRYYGAHASLLVIQTGDGMSTSMTAEGSKQQSLMPTFVSLITSPVVLDDALKRLVRPEDRVDFADVPEEKWADVLAANLSARALRQTNIIEISYRSTDPYAAVAVVNAVREAYLDYMERVYKRTVSDIRELLDKKAQQIKGRIEQLWLERYWARVRFKDLNLDEKNKVHPIVQAVLDYQAALTKATQQRIELETTLESVERAIRNGENLNQVAVSVADTVGKEILASSLGVGGNEARMLATVQQSLLDDQAWMNHWSEELGPNHPRVLARIEKMRVGQDFLQNFDARVEKRMGELQNEKLGPLLREMVGQELARAREMESSLRAQCTRAEEAAVELNYQRSYLEYLDRQWDMQYQLYNALIEQLSRVDTKQEGTDLRTDRVTFPSVNTAPIAPSLNRVLLTAFLAGMAVGLGLIYVQDTLDDRFRSVEEVEARLRVPVLAMVRKIAGGDRSGLDSIQVHAAPDSAESEAFRTLRTSLALGEGPTRRLVITSAEPGDGKTTVLANLAVSFAQSGRKTLLIDADLRRPGLTELFQMRGLEGVAGVVREEGGIAAWAARHVCAAGVEGLDVLPSGARPPNPAELLAHPRFAELLAWAESVYDEVLIDSPPSLATSDTAVIGRLVDGVMIVIQPEKNRRRPVLRAVESFRLLKVPVVGVVLNQVTAARGGDYYGYGGGYRRDEDDELDDPATDAIDGTEVISTRLCGEELEYTAPGGGRRVIPRRVA